MSTDPSSAGIKQDGSTDDWGAWQRLVLKAPGRIVGAGSSFGKTSVLGQPLVIPSQQSLEHVTFQTRSNYAPVDADGALVMLSNRAGPFTASAATNLFTAPSIMVGGYQQSNHTRVVFNAPNGETLPQPLVAGKVYYIDTAPSGTTFTIRATPGGSALDLETDGSGYAYYDVYELSRVYWDYVRLNLTVSGVSGAMLNLQQPAAVKNLRIDMFVAGTSYPAATGLRLGGQIGYVENIELITAAFCRGVLVEGTGMTIRNFNDDGAGNNDVGIEVAGNSVTLDTLWTEGLGTAGVLIKRCRGLMIQGAWLHNASAGHPALTVDAGASQYASYSLLSPISYSRGNSVFFRDVDRGIELKTYGAGGGTIGESDPQFTYHGHIQQAAAAHWNPGPQLLARRWFKTTSPKFRVPYQVRHVFADNTSTAVALTLPSANNWTGHEVAIEAGSHATNTVTVQTDGSDTLSTGGISLALAAGQTRRFVSDGNDWRVLA